jgi:hypothetical protein
VIREWSNRSSSAFRMRRTVQQRRFAPLLPAGDAKRAVRTKFQCPEKTSIPGE